MFDRVEITHLTRPGYQYVDVTEKRAPTDESVRLLREMEKAATDKIIKSLELASNTLNARVHVMKEHLSGKNQFAIIMDLNGKRYDIRASTNEYDSIDTQVEQIYQSIGNQIAQIIMPDVFSTAMKERLFK